jgi:hypothetical protein
MAQGGLEVDLGRIYIELAMRPQWDPGACKPLGDDVGVAKQSGVSSRLAAAF